jgi:hypothetical protein
MEALRRQKKYCSKECYHTAANRKRRTPTSDRFCPCGTSLDGLHANTKYCGDSYKPGTCAYKSRKLAAKRGQENHRKREKEAKKYNKAYFDVGKTYTSEFSRDKCRLNI